MRSIRERLAALQPSPTPLAERRPRGTPIEAIERGHVRSNSSGDVFVTSHRRAEPLLVRFALRDSITPCLYLPDVAQSQVHPRDVLFLDTETTGLAGGTGTHPFIVGIGYVEGTELVVQQFFMRSLADERALLEELRHLLGSFRVLATFNGKTFDWPLLDTRFVLHGYRLRFGFQHLDLLHPARRIWKHRLQSCSLANLESTIFQVRRGNDVPGFLIPQLYFDYLRDGDATRLAPVFAHNREDIVTLVRLLNHMLEAESAPETSLTHAEDQIGLALMLLAHGDVDRAVTLLGSALGRDDLHPAIRRRAEGELCLALKRAGRIHQALPILERMCQRAARTRPIDLFPFEELAKYYEHVEHDYRMAERIVQRALHASELHNDGSGRARLLHRLDRLRRKQISR